MRNIEHGYWFVSYDLVSGERVTNHPATKKVWLGEFYYFENAQGIIEREDGSPVVTTDEDVTFWRLDK